ncbi:MAG: peptidylprolyl isomerase, partial [Pseudomonas neustonica]
ADGEVLDSSDGGAPLVYLQGAGNIIPGLEKALEGKQAGDAVNVTVEPAEAYGEFNAELIAVLGRNMFEGVDELEVGMQFHASGPDGSMQIVTIKALEGDEVTVDGNHPLAGEQLTFDVKVVEVRDATEDEMAHGHIHGEGGVEH